MNPGIKTAAAWIVAAVLLCFSCAVIIPCVMGIRCYAVTSGSMGKTIPVGSLVFAKATGIDQINEGDIVVFSDTDLEESFVHRVVDIERAEEALFTRGDANSADDPYPTAYKYAQGKVLFSIPLIGWLPIAMQSVLAIPVMLIILLAFVLCEIFIVRKRRKCRKGEYC